MNRKKLSEKVVKHEKSESKKNKRPCGHCRCVQVCVCELACTQFTCNRFKQIYFANVIFAKLFSIVRRNPLINRHVKRMTDSDSEWVREVGAGAERERGGERNGTEERQSNAEEK